MEIYIKKKTLTKLYIYMDTIIQIKYKIFHTQNNLFFHTHSDISKLSLFYKIHGLILLIYC